MVEVVDETGSSWPLSVEEVRETGIGPYLLRVIDRLGLEEGHNLVLTRTAEGAADQERRGGQREAAERARQES